jgi:hypothetical protein
MLLFYLSLFLITGLGLFLTKPIPQSLEYHNFADQRTFIDISNFNDVMSNLPFIIIGISELYQIFQQYGRVPFQLPPLYNGPARHMEFRTPEIRSYQIYTRTMFQLVTIWVGCGSMYYHLNPNNSTLIWDRLPMAVAFMLLLTYVLLRARVIRANNYLLALIILQIVGIGSVLIWAYVDDLRLYGLVQFGSIAWIVLLLIRGGIDINTEYLWSALSLYIGAKLCEHLDRLIFSLSCCTVSGHTLKHLLAALATYYVGQIMVMK